MKSVLNKKKAEYPKLMTNSAGNVFMMSGYKSGMCVRIGSGNRTCVLGQIEKYWDMGGLVDLPKGESVTLSN